MSRRPLRVSSYRRILTILVLFGWQAIQAAVAGITLEQANGEPLVLAAPAERIITLAPNLAELVFAAGAGEHLKAVVEYSEYPEQVKQIPRVGDAFRIDLERIIELEPDLVIAWASGNPQSALSKLQQMGVTVWQLEISHPQEIADAVLNISVAAGTSAIGQKQATRLRAKLNRVIEEHRNKAPVSYFYQVASEPLYTVNGEHIISRGLTLCGGNNVFSDLNSLAPQISRESVILADPQVIFSARDEYSAASLDGWKQWPRLRAVELNHLFYLPADQISQATPRFLDSIGKACQLLDNVRSTAATAVEMPLE